MKKAKACRRTTPLQLRGTGLAADQGLAVAQYNLGNMYDNGVGVPLDRCEYMRTTLDVPESMLPRDAARACADGVLMLAKYASQ